MPAPAKSDQVEQNFAAFQRQLAALLQTHPGKFAVMHDGEIVEFCDSLTDAIRLGMSRFNNASNFSVQEVTSRNVNLGFYTGAVLHVPN